MAPDALLQLDPVPLLLSRTRSELSASFDFSKPIRVSRAPGRLDVMGGIAAYTGSLVCETTLDRAAAVVLQQRDDRQLQVFSFNLFDDHLPFTFRMSLDALANATVDSLRMGFSDRGRRWAGYFAGCLHSLHSNHLIDLRDPAVKGVNLAVLSTVPVGAGVCSSAAIEVATMLNLADHFGVREKLGPIQLAAMCHAVENRIVGAICDSMDQVSSCCGEEGTMLRMICQPHELQPSLPLPEAIRVVGINSNVNHGVGGSAYFKSRCAAFMGHTAILHKMREMGHAAGRTLAADPMNGYLANLDPDDYKRHFRPYLPELIRGEEFLATYGPTIDTATNVDPTTSYHVQQATDHHVLEARRVQKFVDFLTRASSPLASSRQRKNMLDKAGHLMYASHLSYTNDALLGADECDLLVQLIRDRESEGFYGAKITGSGSGGTVAVLCDQSPRADAAITQVMAEYEKQTQRKPEAFPDSSPGAWHAGTVVVSNAQEYIRGE